MSLERSIQPCSGIRQNSDPANNRRPSFPRPLSFLGFVTTAFRSFDPKSIAHNHLRRTPKSENPRFGDNPQKSSGTLTEFAPFCNFLRLIAAD